MKILIAMLTALCAASAVSAADPLPDLDWKAEDGKLVNWTGPASPAAENAGAILEKHNAIVFCKRKYLLDGKAKKVSVKFAVQGAMGSIGLYFYEKGGGSLLGSVSERIPNADETREFEAVFELPDRIKNKEVGFFRIFFQNHEGLRLGDVSASLME